MEVYITSFQLKINKIDVCKQFILLYKKLKNKQLLHFIFLCDFGVQMLLNIVLNYFDKGF